MTGADGDPPPAPRRRVVLRLHEVPLLPVTLAELLRVANNITATARDLREAVEQVPDFAARVLLALSTGAAPRGPTFDEALRDVGTRGLRGVVSALALAPLFDPAAARSVDPGRVAEHGVACAMWVAEVASALGRQPSIHLMTAALMHDVGVLLLDRSVGDVYAQALERARREGVHHHDVEREELGMTHARAGALLCARWMLPPKITELVASHHLTTHADPDHRLLAVADHLAGRYGHPTFPWSVPRPVPLEACEGLGLAPGALDELGAHASFVREQTRAIRAAARELPGALDNP